jgi:hypothetical protein
MLLLLSDIEILAARIEGLKVASADARCCPPEALRISITPKCRLPRFLAFLVGWKCRPEELR